MKKVILSLASFMFFGTLLQAQTSKDFSKIDLPGRAADHLMFQVLFIAKLVSNLLTSVTKPVNHIC